MPCIRRSMESRPRGSSVLLGHTGRARPGGVHRLLATRRTTLAMAANAIRSRLVHRIAIGARQAPGGRFSDDPGLRASRSVYGQAGCCLTTHFFGMRSTGTCTTSASPRDAAKVWRMKAFRNGASTRHACAASRSRGLRSSSRSGSTTLLPAHPVHVLAARRGPASAVLPRRPGAQSPIPPLFIRAMHAAQPPEGGVRAAQPPLRLKHRPGPTV